MVVWVAKKVARKTGRRIAKKVAKKIMTGKKKKGGRK